MALRAIDPVRFIGNRSSGKQGHALAAAAQRLGASVTLVTTACQRRRLGDHRGGGRHRPAEMDAAVAEVAPTADVVVMAAAGGRLPTGGGGQAEAEEGRRRARGPPRAHRRHLARLGAAKTAGQTLVRFAAETTDVEANAQAKLVAKGADLLVANDVSRRRRSTSSTTPTPW
ncbi:MAG: phosphopantothenoylcysteine decarboxylase [Acidimicrobiales bacterium]